MIEYAAQYKEQPVYYYRDNPLIEALPPIWDSSEVVDMLSHNEGHHDGERQLGAHLRMHSVLSLFQYFQPLREHVEIERRFSRCIRQGYLHRSPMMPEYAKSLAQGYETIKSKKDYTHLNAFRPTAAGFTIIGLSGVGKTSAVTNILRLYPQVIEHASYQGVPLVLRQVVWLKLDCPYDGLVKGLCVDFFDAVDRAIGTNYLNTHGKRTNSIDMLMILMAQIARLHCIGVLVIDEIQHLSLAKGGGSEKMLNFFVTLVNKIGIPVVLIGTSKAKSILQGDFRQARRSSGQQGDLIWDRMKNNVAWDTFVLSMWRNQWTKNTIQLTDAFKDALYHESQGIVDIAVKLYAMVQIRAIGLGTETFEPSDFHAAASEGLSLVIPMLDALRSGDKKKIETFGDIMPFSIEDYYSAYHAMLPQNYDAPKKRNDISLTEKTVLKLLELGVEPILAKRLAGRVLAEHQELRNVADVVRSAYTLFLSHPESTSGQETHKDDLRTAAGYDDLKVSGIVSEGKW